MTLSIQKLAALPVVLFCLSAGAQQNQQTAQTQAPVAQSITVTTTVEPLPFSESNRSVEVLKPEGQPFLANSVVDLLRVDPSLNLQARAPLGVQADLSIRGTTFEQSIPEKVHDLLDLEPTIDSGTQLQQVHGYVTQVAPSFSLRGGTREVLRGIIARGLGLR